ncbi:TPA: ead/Ea22-like family protein [Escherichia coli]|nr:ead/Ea22-like family protein [Escherichia coli]HCI0273581.1 ead/Ea22-like family protein [Escherichia coli]HCI3360044.1 ead/Ea22-like family protein [Escherichia coli]HCI3410986.1 ead/Ea22-like family protein [Escherichia coli]HCI3685502.1 ead/Ea22-like family protein [Escherichia coli]
MLGGSPMTALNKQALRQLATDAHELGIIKRYTKGIEANKRFVAIATPLTVLAMLDELEAKDSTISTQQQEIRTLLNALEQATEKLKYDIPGQKRLIGWRASDYTDETSDPELAKNWAAAIGVLPIFEGDVNTKLSTAGIGVKGE